MTNLVSLPISDETKLLAKKIDKLAFSLKLFPTLKRYFTYYTNRELEIILPFLKRDDKILDAGGGFGRIAIPLAKMGFSVTLVDVSKKLIEIAIRNAKKTKVEKNIRFVLGDILNIDKLKEKFDVILCLRDVLNYFKFPERILIKFKKVLRNKGYLILSTGTKYSYLLKRGKEPEEVLDIIYYGRSIEEGVEYHLLEKEELLSLVEKNGFKIIKTSGDSILLQLFGPKALDLFRHQNKKLLKKIEKLDRELLSHGFLDFVDHFILVAQK